MEFFPLLSEVAVLKGTQYLKCSHLYFHVKPMGKDVAQPLTLLILPVREQPKVCNIGLSDDGMLTSSN